jgi:hypothetical protein
MSFALFYQPSRCKVNAVERKNPFSGGTQSARQLEPLSVEDVGRVQAVLAAVRARGPDEFGCFVVQFDDGGEAEVYASDLETGCMVAVRGLTPDLVLFLYDFLVAAAWVLLPAMEGNPAIVSSPGVASEFADSFPEMVCGSPEELGAILSGGFDTWKKYRDQVLGEDQ